MVKRSDRKCELCRRESSESWAYQNEFWSIGAMSNAPGWMIMQSRRHAPGIDYLTQAELASFGPLLARLCGAIRTATTAERVYVVSYGENFEHFHMAVVPRAAGVPESHRGPMLLAHAADYKGGPAVAERMATTIGTAISSASDAEMRTVTRVGQP